MSVAAPELGQLPLLLAPCAALLACSCKFAHPFDKAPRVEFNSLGLPLRPGEPECSFYLKHYRQGARSPHPPPRSASSWRLALVAHRPTCRRACRAALRAAPSDCCTQLAGQPCDAHFPAALPCRCAFGHTCKFHHPELTSPPAAAVPMFPLHQYPMHQYPQASTTPMLSSLLGLHQRGASSSGMSPGAPMAAPGMAVSQHNGMGAAAFFVPPHVQGAPRGAPGTQAWQQPF